MTTPSYITKSDLPALIIAYRQAIKENNSSFFFKDTELIVQYAKYLIEYLNN